MEKLKKKLRDKRDIIKLHNAVLFSVRFAIFRSHRGRAAAS